MSFFKIVKNKQHHLKVLLNSFHLNGHTLGFHPQKVQPHLLAQGLTLGERNTPNNAYYSPLFSQLLLNRSLLL